MNAQIGLANRAPNPGQPVWTYEKIMGLVMTLAGGNLNDIQKYMRDAAKPATGLDLSKMTPEMARIDLENPTVKGVLDLATEVRENVVATGRSPAGSTQGPISQRQWEAILASNDEGAKAFFKDQPRLEQVLSEQLRSPEFAAKAAALGITGDKLTDLKNSIGNSLLGSELPMKIVEGLEGRRVYMTLMDKKAGTEMAARDFAVKLNDPELSIPLGRAALAGILDKTIPGIGLSQVPGNYAWNLAEAAGFDLGRKSKTEFLGSGQDGTGFGTINPDGLPPETRAFMEEAHKVTRETMLEVRGYVQGGQHNLSMPLEKNLLPDNLKEFAGRGQQALVEHLVAKRMEEKIKGNPEWRAKISGQAAALTVGEAALAKFPKDTNALFDDAHFDRGVSVTASRVGIDPATHALMLTDSQGKPVLFLRTDRELAFDKPIQGGNGIAFEHTSMDPVTLKAALEAHIKKGGTIEMRMVAEQDGDLGKANVLGVQVVLKDVSGKPVGNTMIAMGNDGGIAMDQSKDQLKALAQGINAPEPDGKPKPGVGYAPGLPSMQGTEFGIQMH